MENKMELNEEELDSVSGGNIFETEIGGSWGAKMSDVLRCGIDWKKCVVTADEYSINGVRLDKDTANGLLAIGTILWHQKYMKSGDYVGFAREWKKILHDNYNINWNGRMGHYTSGF